MRLRLRIVSDVHCEFHRDHGREFIRHMDPRGCDVLVLPGDIAKMRLGFDTIFGLFRERFPDVPVLVVPGNHEYHESDLVTVTRGLKNAVNKVRGLHWLDCSIFEIDGRRILGTTLWYGSVKAPRHPLLLSTDKEWSRGIIKGVTEKGVSKSVYPDYDAIKTLPEWVDQEHERAVRFLDENMREGDIVVTHFLPSQKSVVERFRGALSNCWFVVDVEHLIEERKPALWCHGHTHASMDYFIGPTRIVCNPLGYPTEGEMNRAFDENFTVEV